MIFDGTIRPSLVFDAVGDAYEHVYTGADVIEFNMFRGRRTRLEPLQPATFTVAFDNRAGTYNELSSSTALYFSMDASGIGMVDALGKFYTKEVQQHRGTSPYTVWDGRDVGMLAQKQIVPAAYLNANSGETTDARMSRLVSFYLSAWSVFNNMTKAGTAAMIATFGSVNVWDALLQCAACEAGYFHVTRAGDIVGTNILARIGGTTKLNLSDVTAANNVPYRNLTIVPGHTVLVNQANVTRPSRSTSAGQTTSAAYIPGSSTWGTHIADWQAPLASDTSATALAAYLARINSQPADYVSMVEIAGIDFKRNATTLAWSDLLALEIGDRVSVTRSGTTYDSIVEGIQHSGTTRDWTVKLYLSPYSALSVDIGAGLGTTPAVGTFIYGTPANWTLTAATDTVRPANSLDIKWRDFSDRGAATGTLDLYANAKQEVVYDANSTGAYQFNLKGGSATAMTTTLDVGQCVEFDVLIKCNNTTHIANATVLVDGVSTGVTTIWLGGAPTAGVVGRWDRYKLKVYYVNNTPTYRVVAEWKESA